MPFIYGSTDDARNYNLEIIDGRPIRHFYENQPAQETPTMNFSRAVFLINESIRAIRCAYEPPAYPDQPVDPKHVEDFKSLDRSIAKGDFVVVPTNTRVKMTVVQVIDVDVDVDMDSPKAMDWIVGRVDRSGYTQTVAQEAEAISALRSAEINKKRESMRDALMRDQDRKAIAALPIAHLGKPGEQAEG